MVISVLAECIGKLNTMTVPQLKKEGVDVQVIIDLRDKLIALKGKYENDSNTNEATDE